MLEPCWVRGRSHVQIGRLAGLADGPPEGSPREVDSLRRCVIVRVMHPSRNRVDRVGSWQLPITAAKHRVAAPTDGCIDPPRAATGVDPVTTRHLAPDLHAHVEIIFMKADRRRPASLAGQSQWQSQRQRGPRGAGRVPHPPLSSCSEFEPVIQPHEASPSAVLHTKFSLK